MEEEVARLQNELRRARADADEQRAEVKRLRAQLAMTTAPVATDAALPSADADTDTEALVQKSELATPAPSPSAPRIESPSDVPGPALAPALQHASAHLPGRSETSQPRARLTLERLEQIRTECGAERVELEFLDMRHWKEADAIDFFRSGGLQRPPKAAVEPHVPGLLGVWAQEERLPTVEITEEPEWLTQAALVVAA